MIRTKVPSKDLIIMKIEDFNNPEFIYWPEGTVIDKTKDDIDVPMTFREFYREVNQDQIQAGRKGWYKSALMSRKAEDFEDYIYSIDDERISIINEFFSTPPGTKMAWSVVSYPRLKKIWQDSVRYGVIRDERGLAMIEDQLLRNIVRLQAATDLSGHSQYGDAESIVDDPDNGFRPFTEEEKDDFYYNFLETEYGTPISDYGLRPLWELGERLSKTTNSQEKLLFIDQMLNVIHCRGDLAALFIEGGSASLLDLFEA